MDIFKIFIVFILSIFVIAKTDICAPCTCSNDKSQAFCIGLDLTSIPANLPTTILSLNLEKNAIYFIHIHSIVRIYPNLLYLNLKQNPLSRRSCSEIRANTETKVCMLKIRS